MPWSYVQGTSGHTVTSNLSLVMPGNATAGNLIICRFCQYQTALGSSTVHDTVGPLFTFATGLSDPSGTTLDTEIWWYIQPATRALTVQITSVSYIAAFADEYAPPVGTVAVGQTATGLGSGTALSAGPFAAGAGRLVIVAAGSGQSGATFTQGSGYTLTASIPNNSGSNQGGAAEHKLSALASETPQMTQSAAGNWQLVAASFTPGAGGPGPSSVLLSDGCVPSPLRRHRFPRHIHL